MKIKPCQLDNQAKLEKFITWSNSNNEFLWNNLYALYSSTQILMVKTSQWEEDCFTFMSTIEKSRLCITLNMDEKARIRTQVYWAECSMYETLQHSNTYFLNNNV